MLDWDPPKEDASEDNGGVSDPELEVVHVLERERPMVPGFGREKERSWAREPSESGTLTGKKDIPNEASPPPSAMRQLSSRLWRSSNPFLAWIILSPPNLVEVTDAMDGLLMIIDLAGETSSSLVAATSSTSSTTSGLGRMVVFGIAGRFFLRLFFSTRAHGDCCITEPRETRRTRPPPSIYGKTSDKIQSEALGKLWNTDRNHFIVFPRSIVWAINADDRDGTELRLNGVAFQENPRTLKEHQMCAGDLLATVIHQWVASHRPPCVHDWIEGGAPLVLVMVIQPTVETLIGRSRNRAKRSTVVELRVKHFVA
jgi:hypothetical protein